MKKCPCEECICLAMCKARQSIECEILYNYVNKLVGSHLRYHAKVIVPIAKIFNKRISSIGPRHKLKLKELRS